MCPRCGELFMLIVPSAFRLLEFYHLLLFYHTRLVHMGAHAPTRTHMKIRIHTHTDTHALKTNSLELKCVSDLCECIHVQNMHVCACMYVQILSCAVEFLHA